MVSSEIEHDRFSRRRNEFSLILSHLRKNLPPAQFRMLLQIQSAADHYVQGRRFPMAFNQLWLEELERRLKASARALEVRPFENRHLMRLVHLYQHLFLVHCDACDRSLSRREHLI